MSIGLGTVGEVMGRLPVVGALRSHLLAQVEATLTADRIPGEQYTDPPGDPGLFGPDSMVWRVHADGSMLIGGLAALMEQTLHPLAMAGVQHHSRYRDDPLGRLGRTASFVVATTYGSTPVAEAMIAAVRAVHARVKGVAPDGRRYSAQDPALLTWIHTTEVVHYLRAHQRYVPFPVRGEAADRYIGEMAVLAERLGAPDVPRTRQEVRRYFAEVRPELSFGDQARETMRFLTTPTLASVSPLVGMAHRVVIQAAVGLQPAWVRAMLGLRREPALVGRALDWTVVRPAAFTMLSALRVVGGEAEPVLQARARCAA